MYTSRTYRGSQGIADFAFASLGVNRFMCAHEKSFIEIEGIFVPYACISEPVHSFAGDFDLVYEASRIEDVSKAIGTTIALTLRTSCGLVFQGIAIVDSVAITYDDLAHDDNKYTCTCEFVSDGKWRTSPA